MKWNFIILCLFVTFSVKAQPQFNDYYVTLDADTIKCRIIVAHSIFNKNSLNFHEISKVVKLVDADGKKKFRPTEIAGFGVYNVRGELFKFVSLSEDYSFFFHEIIYGRIMLYRTYFAHPYDGSMKSDVQAYKDGVLVNLSVLGNRKQRITPFFADNAEIAEKWEAMKFDHKELEKIIVEYNNSDVTK